MNGVDGHLRSIVIAADPWGLIRGFGIADHLDVVASASTIEDASDELGANPVPVVDQIRRLHETVPARPSPLTAPRDSTAAKAER